ncbi:DUF2326 domain-containing protein [Poseidonibacter lekithochrous]|uniref:DUF2326 domain-containing protein n=1 Tax=Poseidonibacter TaxID=2321187 RepID=UPI001C08D3B5|nr:MULTISPECIES: DUF2326 domain-containing protein [Poseidonibacter]MBU3014956.1 DUF2326 domain-containing protein [Poseidonibacter lekithochrous]MDO6828253.1 DUF2326 domain-containing protein [Poseidonibacter sp. 1_MG-2023]
MKISKLYSNNDDFKTIVFDKGINFILSDSNGVGKSSLFKLIDFCLLGDKHFLGHEHFKDYIFYIELQIASNRYITIKRPTKSGKNIELKITKQKSMLTDEKDFNKKGSLGIAKSFFENKVNYSINKFRTYITYFLRDESNQNDAFILNKHTALHEIEYKTVISNLIGIDGRKIRKKYELDEIIKKEDIDSSTLKTAQDELAKVIEENKILINSHFIDKLKDSVAKYGNIVLDKEVIFSIDLNTSNDIEFSLKVENDDSTIKKLLCFIFSSSLAEIYVQKRLIKFVAFDSPFNGDKNTYEDGIYLAIHELHRKGIQTIITSNEDAIQNSANLSEIKDEYLTDYFSNDDKLMGDF